MNQVVFNKISEETTKSINEETGKIAERVSNMVSQEADIIISDGASKSISEVAASTINQEEIHMIVQQASGMIPQGVCNVIAAETQSRMNAEEANTESEETTNRTAEQESNKNDKDLTNGMRDEHESEPERLRKLFAGGLGFNSTEESIKSHFEQWGEVTDCIVKRDPSTNRSRCFGFITYKKAHMIDDAQGARPHYIDGRKVDTTRAVPREAPSKPEAQIKVNTLFVKHLKEDIESDDLLQYFGKYGKIKKVNIGTDKSTGKKRIFAFVEFDDYDPVDKVILLRQHFLKGKIIQVQKALPKAGKENFKKVVAMPPGGGITDGYNRGHDNPSFWGSWSTGNGHSATSSWSNGNGHSATSSWSNGNGHSATSSWSNGNGHSAASSWSNGHITPAHFAGNTGADYGSTSGGGAIRSNRYTERSSGNGHSAASSWSNGNGHSAASSWSNGNGHSATSSWSNGYTTPAHFAGNTGADYGSTSGGGAIRSNRYTERSSGNGHSAASSWSNGNGHSAASSWSNGYSTPAHFAGNTGADYGSTSGGGAIRSNRYTERSSGNEHSAASSWSNGNGHSAASSWSNGYSTPAHFAGNTGADYGSTSGGGAIRSNRYTERSSGNGHSAASSWSNGNGHSAASSWSNGNGHSAASSWSNGYSTPAHFAGNTGADYGSTSGGGAIGSNRYTERSSGNGHSAASSWSKGNGHSAASSWSNGNGHSAASSWSNGYTTPAHFAGNTGADYGSTGGGGAIGSNRYTERSQGPYEGGVYGGNSLGHHGIRW